MMKRKRVHCNGKNGYQDLHLTIPEYPETEMAEPSEIMEVHNLTINFSLLYSMQPIKWLYSFLSET